MARYFFNRTFWFLCSVLFLGNLSVLAQESDEVEIIVEKDPSYFYIAIGAVVLLIVFYVLYKKQYRKFNE